MVPATQRMIVEPSTPLWTSEIARKAKKPGTNARLMFVVILIRSNSSIDPDRCISAAATLENPASPIENSVTVLNVSTHSAESTANDIPISLSNA
jgi:hypothetical protein